MPRTRYHRYLGLTSSKRSMDPIATVPNVDPATPETLHLNVFVGEADCWDVTSTLVYGTSEAILVGIQFRISQAKKLSDEIAATGRHLKAIIIIHPDYDLYIGTAVLHERFPEAPIYMTADAPKEFKRPSGDTLSAKKKSIRAGMQWDPL